MVIFFILVVVHDFDIVYDTCIQTIKENFMATRSNINVKVGDKYHSIYCHWSGDLNGNGLTLFKHYNSQELAEKLVSEGDISSLDKECSKPEGHSFDNPVKGYTVYYGRDRGENGVDFNVVDEPLYHQGYSYVWDGDKWNVNSYDYEDSVTLEYALKAENLI